MRKILLPLLLVFHAAAAPAAVEQNTPQKEPPVFSEFLENAWEIEAMADLHAIYVASHIYLSENNVYPTTLAPLIEKGYLDKQIQEGTKGKYRFFLASSADKFAVRADPVDTQAGLKYLFMDHAGELHIDSKPATAESPVYHPEAPFQPDQTEL